MSDENLLKKNLVDVEIVKNLLSKNVVLSEQAKNILNNSTTLKEMGLIIFLDRYAIKLSVPNLKLVIWLLLFLKIIQSILKKIWV